MAWRPNGSLLVTERLRKIRQLKGERSVFELGGVPSVPTASLLYGLLDIKIDPDFKDNSFIYLKYASGSTSALVGVVFRPKHKRKALVNGREIFKASLPAFAGGRNITRIHFLSDEAMLMQSLLGTDAFDDEMALLAEEARSNNRILFGTTAGGSFRPSSRRSYRSRVG